MPPLSASLIAFAPGFALRMAASVKTTGLPAFPGLSRQYTPRDWRLNANAGERLRPDNR